MSNDNKIYVNDNGLLVPFNERPTTVAEGLVVSDIIDLNTFQPNGYFSMQITTTGTTGTLKVQYQSSNDGVSFSVPHDKDGNEVNDIVTAHAVGNQIYAFSPILSRYMRIAIEAATDDLDTVTTKMCAQ
jgi:hypothetical protein